MVQNNDDDANNTNHRLRRDFGNEWEKFRFLDGKSDDDLDRQFNAYMNLIDLNKFNTSKATVVDMGAGSGRWTERLLPYFSKVIAIEPSYKAIKILEIRFVGITSVEIEQGTVKRNSLLDDSVDLLISLGVLHHLSDTRDAIFDCYKKIKLDEYFLCYQYYNLENKSSLYRKIFYLSNFFRQIISNLPSTLKIPICTIIAILVYWPFARISKIVKFFGFNDSNFPLHQYANSPLIFLKNDALDRFGTRIEQRFSKSEIREMFRSVGFRVDTLMFSQQEPFYTFLVQK